MAGIYIHIPFCKQACHYCNFHFSTNRSLQNEMVTAILQEIKLREWPDLKSHSITSIYIGGGTPSLLSEEELNLITNALYDSYSILPEAEITLEANPDDINKVSLLNWKNASINRLSIGIQSFYDDELKWMNRAHSADEAATAVSKSQDAGFSNLSLDLIYGTPLSNMKRWKESLHKFKKLNVPHLSAYGLTVEEKTALAHQIKSGKSKAVDDKLASEQFLFLMNWARNNSYEHYEISNYATTGHRAIHNSNYWNGTPYIGLGPGAHSYMNGKRSWNISNNPAYIKGIKNLKLNQETETLSERDTYNEYIMTAFRTSYGVELRKLKTFSFFADAMFSSIAKTFIANGHMSFRKGHYYLEDEGKLFADKIASEFFKD